MACHNDIILFDLFHMGQIDQIAIVAALEGVLQLFLDEIFKLSLIWKDPC